MKNYRRLVMAGFAFFNTTSVVLDASQLDCLDDNQQYTTNDF